MREAARQEQFLEVVSAEEARRRFEGRLDLTPLPGERVTLAHALGRVLAHDVVAPLDVPPFDRANVDGFALRSADTAGASDGAPKQLTLNAEVIACGHAPKIEVAPGTATTIATGGVVPRGADAVVMIEHTELIESVPAIELRRAVVAGAIHLLCRLRHRARRDAAAQRPDDRLARDRHAGGLRARRDRRGAQAEGRGALDRRRAGAPGDTLRPGGVYDSNGAILAAAVTEAGGEPVPFGAFPDDEAALEQAVRRALDECDMVVLSGGTSKGAGDLSHRIVSKLGTPGILVHGVALKPGKPLCLAVADGQAGRRAAGLSDLGDLHVPRLRRAGDPRPRRICRRKLRRRSRRACRCASRRRWAARNSCWCRWSQTPTARSRSLRRRAPAR